MTKDAIMRRIQELAAERGGHVSYDVFLNETGIKDKWLRRQEWWTGWNKLLSEIGLETREFSIPRTPDSHIAEAVAVIVERDDRWPTEDDLARERKRNNSFPCLQVIRRLRKSGALAKLIVALGETHEQFSKAAMIAKEHLPSDMDSVDLGPDEKVKGYVYMLRSGGRYKIGKATD